MARVSIALTVLALACAVTVSGATASEPGLAHAAAKCAKKKHRHGKKRKRCRKANGTGGTTGGGDAPATLPGRLGVTEREISPTELQLQLSRPSVTAGDVIVEQQNAGEDPHNLIVQKSDDSAVFTYPTLDPGLNQKQTLPLTAGSWTLYCSLLDHKDLGMQATLIVN